MASTKKTIKETEANKRYLTTIFQMLKKRENLELSNKNFHYTDTELRLIGEILAAKYEGKRLISTQLAGLLGVTRSAISQIVNRLEEKEVVKRVADDVDRKIAYIEITEKCLTSYSEDLEGCLEFVGELVSEYGEEKFYMLCSLFEEFIQLVEKKKNEYKQRAL